MGDNLTDETVKFETSSTNTHVTRTKRDDNLPRGHCLTCNKITIILCHICNTSFICSGRCTRDVPQTHKSQCRKAPPGLADELLMATLGPWPPYDLDTATRARFGFDLCENHFHEAYLLTVYKTLFLDMNIGAAQVQGWRTESQLGRRVKEVFELWSKSVERHVQHWFDDCGQKLFEKLDELCAASVKKD